MHAAQNLTDEKSQCRKKLTVAQPILGHPGTIDGRPRRCLKFILFHGEFGQIYERSGRARL